MEILLYKGYIGNIKFSDEDNLYYGSIQNADGYFYYDGETKEILTDSFKTAVDDYIANAKDIAKNAKNENVELINII